MILTEIRDYLQTRQRAALSDMALHFRTDPEALRGMLEKWVVKGRIEKLSSNAVCRGGCCKCDALSSEIYQWKQ